MVTVTVRSWIWLVGVCCVFAVHTCLFGQQSYEAKGLDLQLTTGQKTIAPYEPVYLKYSLRNRTDLPQTATGLWQATIYIKKDDAGVWDYYNRPSTAKARPLPSRTGTIVSGETLDGIVVVDVNADGQHAFARPGRWWVKTKFAGMESAAVAVTVQQPSDADKPACRYLEDHPLYLFFTEWMAHESLKMPDGKDPGKELARYAGMFPSSRYAQWAALGGLWVMKARAGDNRHAMEAVRHEMEKTAPHLACPMRSLCCYEAGVAAFRLGDTTGANLNFDCAIEQGESVFARDQVRSFWQNKAYIRQLVGTGDR